MDDFFSYAGLLTLTGATAAVVVVSNTARKLFKRDTVWIPFAVSVVVVVVGAISTGKLHTPASYLLALLNSCLLFCTALGANDSVIANVAKPAGGTKQFSTRPIRWSQSWLRRRDN